MRIHLISAAVFCGIMAGAAQAQPKTAAVPAPGEGLLAEAASNDVFELVLKHPPLSPGKMETVKIFLTDYATNTPIEKARIEIQSKGPAEIKATASETDIPGIYESKIAFPKNGTYDLVIDIKAGDISDILVLKISVGSTETVGKRGIMKSIVLWTLLVALLLSAATFIWAQKAKLKNKSLVLVCVLGMAVGQVWAHEGHDEGPSTEDPLTSGAPIYLSKESQFLLGVRTAVAASQELKKRISTLGHVTPRSQGKADVISLQAGRLIAEEHYKLPQIGDRIKKGQVVAEIQVIDSFHVLAPISGIVTEVNFTAGEWLEQGKKLLTIVDPAVVWVEANIFEGELRSVEGARQAFIKSQTYPDLEFKGRLVTLGTVLDTETRSVKAVFEVANPAEKLRPGMFVDVAIETKASQETLAIPASAVLDRDGQRVVFVKTKAEIFVERQIEIVGKYGDLIAVKSGLSEDERVVTVGNYQLLTTPSKAPKAK